jgi:chitinase
MVWTVDMDDFTGNVCGNNVKYPLIGAMREELRGVSRGKDAKDVDWEKVAATIEDQPVCSFIIIKSFKGFIQ